MTPSPDRPSDRPSGRRRSRRGRPNGERRYFTQQGVALIAVAVAMALTGAIVTEFSTNTNVDMAAAYNAQSDMQAHFLARSAMNLGQLVVRVQTDVVDQISKQTGWDIQIGDFAGMFLGVFGTSKKELADMGDLLPGVRIDSVEGLGIPAGSFDVVITTEDGKINLNCAGDRAGNTQKTLVPKLQALFYFDAYDPIFQNEDAEGWRRDRNQQIEALIDYVDPDRVKYDAVNMRTGGGPEDYGYESLTDEYEAKNNYLDSVGEIKQVRGVDDRFWTLFGSNFTVYGGCKENLSAISDPKHLAAIIFLGAKNPEDPVLRDPQKLWALAQYVAKIKSMGVLTSPLFASTQSFADLVKDPTGGLGGLAGGLAGESGVADALTGQLGELTGGVPIEGVELDKGKLDQIVDAGARRTYRLEATATHGNLTKRIVGVWDKEVTRQNLRDPASGDRKGAWVFWREE